MKPVIALALLLLPLELLARVDSGEPEEAISAEPDITIVEEQDKQMQIYQINGKIYGIKVIPKQGEPYNLVDTNGDNPTRQVRFSFLPG